MTGTAKKDRIWILILSILSFIPFLGSVHLFDWDEINFAECAREMIISNDYLNVQVAFKSFYEKPPMFIWLQVVTMQIFGINEFAARLPNAICGIVSLQIIYSIGSNLKNTTLGRWWVSFYVCSFLPHFYFKSGIIDPWFNLFIFLSFFQLFRYFNQGFHQYRIILASIYLGLSLLTKGPVAVLLLSLSVLVALAYSFYKKEKNIQELFTKRLLKHGMLFLAISLLPTAIWYSMVVWQNGPSLIYKFFEYQIRLLKTEDAGHGGFPGYHVVVLLVGCFPASIFALRFLKTQDKTEPILYWMKSLFWVVLILFSIVQSKIVHYSSLAYFPITFIAAYNVNRIMELRTWQKIFSAVLMTILGILIICLPWIGKNIHIIKPLIKKDKFALANLSADANWTGYESILGLIIITCMALFSRFNIVNKVKHSILALLASSFLTIQGIIYFFVPKIEAYSQRSAIDFFKTLSGKDICVNTLGYKSYAHLFYSNAQPNLVCDAHDTTSSTTFKAKYIVTKITTGNPPELKQFERLYEKNGFVFWRK